jgi:hypothetical protein
VAGKKGQGNGGCGSAMQCNSNQHSTHLDGHPQVVQFSQLHAVNVRQKHHGQNQTEQPSNCRRDVHLAAWTRRFGLHRGGGGGAWGHEWGSAKATPKWKSVGAGTGRGREGHTKAHDAVYAMAQAHVPLGWTGGRKKRLRTGRPACHRRRRCRGQWTVPQSGTARLAGACRGGGASVCVWGGVGGRGWGRRACGKREQHQHQSTRCRRGGSLVLGLYSVRWSVPRRCVRTPLAKESADVVDQLEVVIRLRRGQLVVPEAASPKAHADHDEAHYWRPGKEGAKRQNCALIPSGRTRHRLQLQRPWYTNLACANAPSRACRW